MSEIERVDDLRGMRDYEIVAEVDRLRRALAERTAAVERLTTALDRCMVGGNHIASALISALGPDFNEIPSYDAAFEQLWGKRADTDDMLYDAWMCWKAIMEARETAGGPDWKDQRAALAADQQPAGGGA